MNETNPLHAIAEYADDLANNRPPRYDYRMYETARIPEYLAAARDERNIGHLARLRAACADAGSFHRGRAHIYAVFSRGRLIGVESRQYIPHPPERLDDDSAQWLEEAARAHIAALYRLSQN